MRTYFLFLKWTKTAWRCPFNISLEAPPKSKEYTINSSKAFNFFFFEASQRSGLLKPWIWFVNYAHVACPTFSYPDRLPSPESAGGLKFNNFTPAQQNFGFFLLEWNFSLNDNCKVKGKISNGIQWLSYSQKSGCSCDFVDTILLVSFFSSCSLSWSVHPSFDLKVGTHEGTKPRNLLQLLVPCNVYPMGVVAGTSPLKGLHAGTC